MRYPESPSRFPAELPHDIPQIEDRIQPQPPGLEFAGRNLREPVPGQSAQLLGCLHLQHRLEMLLGPLHVSQLHIGKGEDVDGLRVLGIDLVGLAQVVEGFQAVALLAEDGAHVLEGHGIPGIGGQGLHGELLGLRKVARPW